MGEGVLERRQGLSEFDFDSEKVPEIFAQNFLLAPLLLSERGDILSGDDDRRELPKPG